MSLEIGAIVFFEKSSYNNGLIYCPLKLGYRYTFNREGTGFYVEPQLGYNVYGAYTTYNQTLIDKRINGFITSATTGYLFKPWGTTIFDLGLRFESINFDGVTKNSVGIRLSRNFSIGRKRD